ncbi:cysteine hydrolase [Herbaspirillum sp. GCM10030257]|uniref:cysteine hydrolase n=1 Tax=Herbaspirillum sp. GCM10030257 TaxID=3273393 RepID=UPI00361AFF73
MNVNLLIIDPQNDFCDIPGAALPVTGADGDMKRLAAFIAGHGSALSSITITLDSHASVAVERTTFWAAHDGGEVPPFTVITLDSVRTGIYVPRDRSLLPSVTGMLEKLEQRGKHQLIAWPVHCVTGTWGHNIHTALSQQLNAWEFARQTPVTRVLKGQYPLSEHYGVFEAEVPHEDEEATKFNERLATDLLRNTDLLLIAGEASSHCVAASVEQLLGYAMGKNLRLPRMVLLRDCMSAVTGFDAAERGFFERAGKHGVERLTANEVAELLD